MMLRDPNHLLLVGLLAVLSGCSGGSGSATAPVVVEGVFTHTGQRMAVRESLGALQPLMFADLHFDLGFVPDADVRRGAFARHRFTPGTCVDGFKTSVGAQTNQTAGGVLTTSTPVTAQAYYDAACTMLWRTFTGTETTAGIPDAYTSYAVTGSEVIVSKSGAEIQSDSVSYEKEQGGGVDEGFLVTATSPAGIASKFFGGCGNQDCDHGSLQQDGNASFGVLIPELRTALGISSNGNGTTFIGTLTDTSLVVDGCCNASIAGGQQSNDLIELPRSTSVNADGTRVTSATSAIIDTAIDAQTTATFAGSSASGVVTRESGSTTPLATYTIDVNGNGSVRYADGSTGIVTAFVPQ